MDKGKPCIKVLRNASYQSFLTQHDEFSSYLFVRDKVGYLAGVPRRLLPTVATASWLEPP